MKNTTIAVHGGTRKDDTFGAINEPIYMTSNYRIPTDGTPVDWSGTHSNIYQRNRNVNQMVLQDKLCAMTGAEDCAVFASGVAALSAVFTTFLNSGDHAIVSEVCYSATRPSAPPCAPTRSSSTSRPRATPPRASVISTPSPRSPTPPARF